LALTPDSLYNYINVNIMGPAKIIQLLENHLQNGSVVMNMASGLGSMAYNCMKENVECTAYGISKAALNMLTVHQASNFRDKGVVVVCVDPGWVKTDMGGPGAVLKRRRVLEGC
jgi:NAD(P)-dependent dehydrogenase (short-subunit alcohol dehydrogenase family)